MRTLWPSSPMHPFRVQSVTASQMFVGNIKIAWACCSGPEESGLQQVRIRHVLFCICCT